MTARTDDDLAVRLRRTLADELARRGDLRSLEWRRAVETVPREVFLGERIYRRVDAETWTRWEPLAAADLGAERWLGLAYTDESWVTQLDGRDGPAEPDQAAGEVRGTPTSSSTMPGLVVRMLEDLRVEDGHRVLEIGTGTGYSTALMCERLGAGLVTSVEVDPGVAARARDALHRAGYRPALVVGDGLAGHPAGAPYDRAVATCAVRNIPGTWLEQVRPGGLVLATLSGWLYGSALARLTLTGPGEAEGEFLPGTVSFMPARPHAAPPPGELPPREGERRAAVFGAEVLDEWTSLWIAQLAMPTATSVTVCYPDDEQPACCLVDHATGSWAWLHEVSEGRTTVRQSGPIRIWDRIEAALGAWHEAGAPEQQAFRLRVSGGEQVVFLPDAPALCWRLPG
ncbi:ATP-grasp peptide maturase system methyltransferase [Planomonospora parontospora]|uniref:ATP-grasp peptide maturase system methyltransferase n=1 Tax=Planomonospora parontospora TaxID=58119 RepID=UPI00166FAE04|nr:ATP-grasp peptide maturase system methyltransferase [Planomonospora parontospora]GGL43429.1 SAM-dependent methyltransferase [Planomonospora parontospora subsp. antibiotica]GII18423.1 SAM-dependent methyltransferase [Planomonospora parontospora subsp. antibiotica]